MTKELKEKINLLIESFLKLEDYNDVVDYLDDLCTIKELNQLEQRLEAAKMLLDGATYDEVIKATSISSATLSRVSKCVQNGKGYKKILEDKNNLKQF